MFLDLASARVHGLALSVDVEGDHVRALEHVEQEEGGVDAGLHAESGTTFVMLACPNLEVE